MPKLHSRFSFVVLQNHFLEVRNDFRLLQNDLRGFTVFLVCFGNFFAFLHFSRLASREKTLVLREKNAYLELTTRARGDIIDFATT